MSSKATAVQTDALAVREEFSVERSMTNASAMAQFEIQSAMTIAQRFPRNEDLVFQKLKRSCERSSFADLAEYSFPRGTTEVRGPSVHLAREAGRCWGNLRWGVDILRDDEESRQIRGWAWDLETNVKVSCEDDFGKKIFRKSKGWITPDERELRELTNRRGAILERNAILEILPSDLIEDARERCAKTRKSAVEKDPDGARKSILAAFDDIGVSAVDLATYLEHPVSKSSPAEIEKLRTIYKSIKDGNSTWAEYVEPKRTEPEKGTLDPDALKPGAEPNRGHGNEGFAAEASKPASAKPKSGAKSSIADQKRVDKAFGEAGLKDGDDWEEVGRRIGYPDGVALADLLEADVVPVLDTIAAMKAERQNS